MCHKNKREWIAQGHRLPIGTLTHTMGVLNITPDSFSDGGAFFSPESAVQRAAEMVRDGAQLLDIGGESTRPGHEIVAEEEEIRRVVPVICRVAQENNIPISIDTSKSKVAIKAIEAGASIINDVYGLHRNPQLAHIAAENNTGLILMFNNRVKPEHEKSANIVSDACDYLKESIEIALRAGVPEQCIIVDPGIGFGMNHEESFELIRSIPALSKLGFPVMVGPSRKRFIGAALGNLPVDQREAGTLAVSTLCAYLGADVIRVHRVKEVVEALLISDIFSQKRQLEDPNYDRIR